MRLNIVIMGRSSAKIDHTKIESRARFRARLELRMDFRGKESPQHFGEIAA